jgi:hypothetical protein
MPDAAGLVLASDQDDARAYADIVTRITGERPALILSDDPKAGAAIARFTDSDERIAVCVRMISEGVDVPRAACLAWMTSYRTPLFFAQAVGRVVRGRGPHESATVFLPAVRPLLALAAELEAERNHVIPPPAAGSDLFDADDLERPEPTGVGEGFEALESEAEFAHVLHGGRAVLGGAQPAGSGPTSADDEDFLGLPGLLSPEQTAALLARRDVEHRRRAGASQEVREPADADLPAYEQVTALRRRLSAMVSSYSLASGRTGGSMRSYAGAPAGRPPPRRAWSSSRPASPPSPRCRCNPAPVGRRVGAVTCVAAGTLDA